MFPEAVLQVGSLDGLDTEELYSHLTQPEHSHAQSMSSGMQAGSPVAAAGHQSHSTPPSEHWKKRAAPSEIFLEALP